MTCSCLDRDVAKRARWVVMTYRGNYSAFSGYRFTPSDYSEVRCDEGRGGCGARWRTKAAYVEDLPRSPFA